MSEPKIAVCISTRNRARHLPRLIAHLERQTLDAKDFEVVIVDNGSTDETWAVLQDAVGRTPLRLQILQNPPGKGPAAGRNRAWRAATAPWCAFTDDDCTPRPTWLAAAERGVAGRSVIGAGAVRPPHDEIPLIGPFTRTVFALRQGAEWCATANLIVRREDLEAVGGFDESFLNVAGEDTDMGLRIMARGAAVTYLDDAVVEHPVEQMSFVARLREQQRWVDIPAVFARNPWARKLLLHRRLFWKPVHVPTILLLVGALVASRRRWGALLAGPWLHERLCSDPLAEMLEGRVRTLPAALIMDVSEVTVMLRGSIRHRALVL